MIKSPPIQLIGASFSARNDTSKMTPRFKFQCWLYLVSVLVIPLPVCFHWYTGASFRDLLCVRVCVESFFSCSEQQDLVTNPGQRVATCGGELKMDENMLLCCFWQPYFSGLFKRRGSLHLLICHLQARCRPSSAVAAAQTHTHTPGERTLPLHLKHAAGLVQIFSRGKRLSDAKMRRIHLLHWAGPRRCKR